jgi:hypothetical protein
VVVVAAIDSVMAAGRLLLVEELEGCEEEEMI